MFFCKFSARKDLHRIEQIKNSGLSHTFNSANTLQLLFARGDRYPDILMKTGTLNCPDCGINLLQADTVLELFADTIFLFYRQERVFQNFIHRIFRDNDHAIQISKNIITWMDGYAAKRYRNLALINFTASLGGAPL